MKNFVFVFLISSFCFAQQNENQNSIIDRFQKFEIFEKKQEKITNVSNLNLHITNWTRKSPTDIKMEELRYEGIPYHLRSKETLGGAIMYGIMGRMFGYKN